ncbi:Hok/Gef family protein [Escherichia coli]
MPEHHKVSLLLVGNQHRGLGMPQKYRLLSLIVICFTLLFFTKIILDFITRSIIYFLKNK